jgi:hypothetical protein
VVETWYLTGQNNLTRVNALDRDGIHWYAATEQGLYRGEISNTFLTSFENWEELSEIPLPEANYTDIAIIGNRMFLVLDGDPLDEVWYAEIGDWNWVHATELDNFVVDDLHTNASSLAVCAFQKVSWLTPDLEVISIQQNINGNVLYPQATDFDSNGNVWIASNGGGLLFLGADLTETNYLPAGPPAFNARRLDAYNNNLWVASGGVDATWTSNYDKKGIYGLVNDQWVFVPSVPGENDIAEINDYMCVAVDPLNNQRLFLGSWEEGLIEVENGAIKNIFNQNNSPLQQANFGGSVRIGVGGADFDEEGNLWFSNAYSSTPLHVYSKGGNFTSFSFLPDIGTDDFLGDILTTRQGYVWSIVPRAKGLMVLNHNGTPSDPSDDSYRVLTNEAGAGGLTNIDVYSITEDLDGEIWVGTLQGISVFYAPDAIFSGENFDAQTILIEQDGNIQELLATEQINAIEIDGANRKWIATASSGVYLVSPDGIDQILHFTAENSPLLSNNVVDITINHSNGEIFFATDRGIISYMSDATNFDEEISTLSIYPNPVREDFSGLITIDGLSYECDVKITDIAGHTVYATTSNGGRAVWDGNGPDGRRVATGVYLIFASRQDGQETNVGRIAVIR